MRVAPLLVVCAVVWTTVASAQTPPCAPGVVNKLSITPMREHLRFQGTFTAPEGFDPMASGLQIDFAYEPGTDPSDGILSASLPGSSFTQTTNGLRYLDHTAAIAGMKVVAIFDVPGSPGVKRIKVNRRDILSRLPADQSGAIRVTLTSGGACVRSCDSPCTTEGLGSRMRCLPSVDPCP